jgi:hypothetical protein
MEAGQHQRAQVLGAGDGDRHDLQRRTPENVSAADFDLAAPG